jgi:hypothetical protein
MVNLFLSRTSSSFCFLAPILCDNGAFILLLLQLDAGTKLDCVFVAHLFSFSFQSVHGRWVSTATVCARQEALHGLLSNHGTRVAG